MPSKLKYVTREDRILYRDMVDEFGDACWCCGRTSRMRPKDWWGEWYIERAHIVTHPRTEHRQSVILLCSLCHRVQHGDRFPQYETVRLGVAEMMYLKMIHDPEFFDVQFLQDRSIQRLPLPKSIW